MRETGGEGTLAEERLRPRLNRVRGLAFRGRQAFRARTWGLSPPRGGEGEARLLPTAFSTVRDETHDSGTASSSKKEPELKDFGNFSASLYCEKRKNMVGRQHEGRGRATDKKSRRRN